MVEGSIQGLRVGGTLGLGAEAYLPNDDKLQAYYVGYLNFCF